ncbi:subtilisin SUB7 [Toxoplasma gondii VAND]|uniref:subtilisin n=1 Tax=Toxoplasma gondii VAND TaxID=933077 RepID=A0A086QHN7_TOXGO|nr:subtilisin SUB7 [Toxoplasma gondii VAND]
MAGCRERGRSLWLLSTLFLAFSGTPFRLPLIAFAATNGPHGTTLLLTYMPECVDSGATMRALRRSLSRNSAYKASHKSGLRMNESAHEDIEAIPLTARVIDEYAAYRTKVISLDSAKQPEQVGEDFEPVRCSISEESLKRVGVDVIELRNCEMVGGDEMKEALETDPCVASVEYDEELSIDSLQFPAAERDTSEDDPHANSPSPSSDRFSDRRRIATTSPSAANSIGEPLVSVDAPADGGAGYWRDKSGLNDSLYDLADCDPKRVVAVIDTGVSYTHPALVKNMWVNQNEISGNGIDDDSNGFIDDVYGFNFRENKGDPMDDHGHGTHVAGIIGAIKDQNSRVKGVCGNTSIAALKFMGANGNGSTSDAIKALNYAVQMGIPLSCNSWGGPTWSEALIAALEAAESVGHLFIAAAGNQGRNTDEIPHYPASYRLANVVSVAATNSEDQLAPFSNRGAATVDLAAPGVKILSTFPPDQFRELSGTSMATPVVAGVAAILMSLPYKDTKQIKTALVNGVDKMPATQGFVKSGGRVNASRSLSWLALELDLGEDMKVRRKETEIEVNDTEVEEGRIEHSLAVEPVAA